MKPTDDLKLLKYELYAIACHSGEMGSGHYTAFVKHDTKWYHISDSHWN